MYTGVLQENLLQCAKHAKIGSPKIDGQEVDRDSEGAEDVDRIYFQKVLTMA